MATVMIVDDDYKRGTSVFSAIHAEGYESSLVGSMDAALEMMYHRWPDVVILAENLNDWDGLSSRHYRMIYPNLYNSQLSQDDARFFLRLGHLLKAEHVVAYSFCLN